MATFDFAVRPPPLRSLVKARFRFRNQSGLYNAWFEPRFSIRHRLTL